MISSSVAGVTSAHAGQTIELNGSFKALENAPAIALIVRDEDADTVKPFLFSVAQKRFFKTIHLAGNHYKIMSFAIQYNGGSTENICSLGQEIDNQATLITLTGDILGSSNADASHTRCSVKYTSIIPDPKAVNFAAANTVASANTPAVSDNASATAAGNGSGNAVQNGSADADIVKGRQEIARYLTGLKSCKQSRYAANINNQSVVYDIRGNQNSLCEVDIAADKGKPIKCLLSQEDIAVIASNDQIKALSSGKLSTSKLASELMAKRCHTLS